MKYCLKKIMENKGKYQRKGKKQNKELQTHNEGAAEVLYNKKVAREVHI